MSAAAKGLLFGALRKAIQDGFLEVRTPDGEAYAFGDPKAELRGELRVHNERFFSRVLQGGEDAAGDAYMDGDWTTGDLVALVRLIVRNLQQFRISNSLTLKLNQIRGMFRHRSRGNTIEGSRKNIAEHYDLSNDFFRLFLDEKMVYSAGIFLTAGSTLEESQMEKIDRLCRKLRLRPGERLLEIGTGWGAFALHAARQYGCEVTTTTISRQQHDYAARQFAGTPGIRLLLEDYRRLTGTYDKIACIEMFEAVGLKHYGAFFMACDRLLKPGGTMAMQTITMNEQNFPKYIRTSDWIQRRIFPGGELASLLEIQKTLARRTSSMGLTHLEDIGLDYARTLREWRRRFHARLDEVRRLGFDDRFIRMWDFYLGYCEGAFLERYISDVQLVLTKRG